MAISIDWPTGVITVPRADLTFVGVDPISGRDLYEHDTEAFREELLSREDDFDGIAWPKTHIHNTEVTLSGVVYVRTIQIIPPYSVEYEDGNYAVSLIGSNNNIADVAVINSVSVRPNNTAGNQKGLSKEDIEPIVRKWNLLTE